jgi:threonine/homoserine/homoserine lactone efflux protein
MAFLPQFVDIKISHPILQFALLGLILSLMAFIWFGTIGYFAGTFGVFIRKSKTIQNWIKYASGSIMIGLGLRLAIKRD